MGMKKGKPDHEISKNSIPRDNSYRLRAVRKQTNEDKKKRPLISQIKVFFFLFTKLPLTQSVYPIIVRRSIFELLCVNVIMVNFI
jgi:hypothetical protein